MMNVSSLVVCLLLLLSSLSLAQDVTKAQKEIAMEFHCDRQQQGIPDI